MTPSYVADARVALEGIPEIVSVLSREVFPSAFGPTSIIKLSPQGDRRVRFNPEEVRRWASRDGNPVLTSDANAALREFGQVLDAVAVKTVIAPGDCLVLNNWIACHGRGRLAPDSGRVLKRMWVS
jgi:Taurine catabolism dioxygenase TauD, TfdA family